MEHKVQLRVRSYECDGNNHVNNAVYLNYLEYARMEFLNDHDFDYKKFRDAGFGIIIAKICINYRKPAFLNDSLTIITKPIKTRKTSGMFSQRILRRDEEISDAEVWWVCINEKGKPSPFPEGFKLSVLFPREGGGL